MRAHPFHRDKYTVRKMAYNARMRTFFAAAFILAFLVPSLTFAFPFGGQASQVLPCPINNAILAYVGPPRGGAYIWTPSTRYYRFGPPTHAGQWLLGLAGIPYYCGVSIQPIDSRPGFLIIMMGSSQ